MKSFQLKNIFNKGFTLIEILVVIAIMSILSGIVYTSFNGVRAQSRDQKRLTDISDIQLSLEMYYIKYKAYPDNLGVLKDEGFISMIPEAPTDDPLYGYNYFPIIRGSSNACNSYQLWTTFERDNSHLGSKIGLNSIALPSIMQECGSGHPKVNASSSPKVYDVMPQF